MSTEGLADRQSDRPRRADVVADTRAQAAFPVERKLRIRVEDVGRVGRRPRARCPSASPSEALTRVYAGSLSEPMFCVAGAEVPVAGSKKIEVATFWLAASWSPGCV